MIKTRTGKIEKQMIDLLGECLIPIKGYPFSRETTAFDLVRKERCKSNKQANASAFALSLGGLRYGYCILLC